MNGADWPMTFLPRGRALRSEQPGFPCPRSPQSTGKGPTQCSSCHDSSHILPSRPHMARRFLMGSMWPEGLHRSLASHRLRISGPQSSAARRYLGSIPHTVATGRRVPPGSPGTHSHCAPSGLLPLQWLDRSPVHTEGRLGRVNHHDGGAGPTADPRKQAPLSSLLHGDVHRYGLLGPQRSRSSLQGSGWEVSRLGFLVAHRAGFSHRSLFPQVHSLYRRTGASFQQAQEEFSQGIFSSRTFQSAASSAARGAFQGN